jgi:hypothetical protein
LWSEIILIFQSDLHLEQIHFYAAGKMKLRAISRTLVKCVVPGIGMGGCGGNDISILNVAYSGLSCRVSSQS